MGGQDVAVKTGSLSLLDTKADLDGGGGVVGGAAAKRERVLSKPLTPHLQTPHPSPPNPSPLTLNPEPEPLPKPQPPNPKPNPQTLHPTPYTLNPKRRIWNGRKWRKNTDASRKWT